MTHDTALRTRYGETDQMGIIYHPNYYIYFEIGRTEFLREKGGMSYKDMEEAGVMLPIVETHCKYRVPAKYDDELVVRTMVKNMTAARITFSYQLIRATDGVLLAEGETTSAFTNKEGRPINLKKKYPDIYDRLFNFISY
ncbi:acyl-CoA thioesterase [Lutispora thermophila]|uniref:Acyl-CoA thioester hydrolase n=1 Tax=Lutispora thermophila DSM 19022 TaxID=1122184 RepID=A0A1M6I9G1_9FIRM|nr:thioesterase family protein [Lutispora thermophila]SHJ31080.1 acyl-CoA thioester hydrolase [Lutispora thermophila DSM 19022]